ncbi:unnamed protein product [Lymnaea stagnalis]|uniref:Matrix-remodeling-associated protein 7 helical domain-containing protein n=1 Tax=Lymnaea stagnalis TaxID=6523 RepID=A0AAV2H1F0_LYMST
MDVATILTEHSANICVAAVIVTILALVISTRYSVRNFLNIRGTKSKNAEDEWTNQERSINEVTENDKGGEMDANDDSNTGGAICSPRYPDPVDYCEHIQGEIKRVQQSVATRTIAKNLTEEQLNEEREVQRKQLAEIFKLMQEQQDRFGIGSMDDMQEQMKLYAV